MATAKALKLLQGVAQAIAKPALKTGSSLAAGVEGLGNLGGAGIASMLRKPDAAKRLIGKADDALTRERDFGALGKVYPVGMKPGDSTVDSVKDIVGTGMQLGAFAAPVGSGAKAASLGAALASGASRGALQGGLAAGGQALSEDDTLKQGLLRTGAGALTGGLVGGALSGAQYEMPKVLNALRTAKADQRGEIMNPLGGGKPKPDLVDQIMAFEDGSLSDDETIKLFQELVDSGKAWQLQGSYGRQAQAMLDAGLIQPPTKTGVAALLHSPPNKFNKAKPSVLPTDQSLAKEAGKAALKDTLTGRSNAVLADYPSGSREFRNAIIEFIKAHPNHTVEQLRSATSKIAELFE